MRWWMTFLVLGLVLGCESEGGPDESGEEWSITLEGSFSDTGLIVGRGDMKISLFPEEGDGLMVNGFAYEDAYLFSMSHEGSYVTEWGGTAGPLSGLFNITIPSRYTERTIVLAWADSAPIGSFEVNVERSATEWNSLLRLPNGDLLGPLYFDGDVVRYETWVNDPVDGPHEETHELTADLWTGLTLAHAWSAEL